MAPLLQAPAPGVSSATLWGHGGGGISSALAAFGLQSPLPTLCPTCTLALGIHHLAPLSSLHGVVSHVLTTGASVSVLHFCAWTSLCTGGAVPVHHVDGLGPRRASLQGAAGQQVKQERGTRGDSTVGLWEATWSLLCVLGSLSTSRGRSTTQPQGKARAR